MSEEIRQLATALKSLAESQQGTIGLLREQLAIGAETNRTLATISDQQQQILECMRRSEDRHAESERNMRAVQATIKRHGKRIEGVEAALGIAPADQ